MADGQVTGGFAGPAPYALRRPLETEFEVLYALHYAAMGEYIVATWGPWIEEVQREFFAARMTNGYLRVIEVDGLIAGLLEVEEREEGMFLTNIQLAPEYQGRGLGSTIIGVLQAETASRGRPLDLTVLRVNPAKRLYARLGFVETQLTDTHHHLRWMPPGPAGTYQGSP